MDLQPLTPKAAATVRLCSEHRINIWEGAVRSGKTISSLLAWIEFVSTAPPGPLLMAGKTVDTLRRNAIDPMIELLGTQHVKVVWGVGVAWILGRKVHLVGGANEMAESRIRGLTLAGAYVDEITIMPQGWWQMLLSRMSVEGAKIFGTTNPASPQHWLLTDYLDRAQTIIEQGSTVTRTGRNTGIARYRFVIDDNPSLPAEYVDNLKNLYTGLFYRRFIEGAWVSAEGAVYPMLDYSKQSKHLWTQLPAHEEFEYITIGVDHGMSNPTHAVVLGIKSDKIFIISELRVGMEENGEDKVFMPKSIAQQATDLEEWIRDGCPDAAGRRPLKKIEPNKTIPYRIVVDPAAKAFRVEWNDRGNGWTWQADNSVLKGIQRVGALFDTNRLMINQSATPILASELSGYSWDTKAQQMGLDRPMKIDDHGADALRYAVMAVERTLER